MKKYFLIKSILSFILIFFLIDQSQAQRKGSLASGQFITARLFPGSDLKNSIMALASEHKVSAGSIVSAVGSLKNAAIRFADSDKSKMIQGPLELVSLTGTFSKEAGHFHVAVADKNGKVTGGHLKEGSLVFTTIEIVVLSLDGLDFRRTLDPATGYSELDVQTIKAKSN